MPDEAFQVGDRVFLTSTRQYGMIVKVTLQRSHNEPDESDEPEAAPKKLYDIELDSGKIMRGVYHGLEHAGDGG